jgi:hypothetical protein
LEIEQPSSGLEQNGASGLPSQKPTHTPMLSLGSTSQHIDAMSQSSMPLTPLPSTVQVSPT